MLSCAPAALAATDEEFLRAAIGINLAEIDMGEMASEKGRSDDVKTFGQTLIDDHMKANDEAKKLAESLQVEIPTEPSQEAQKVAEELGGKQGAEFDDAFADHMVMGHEQAITLFEDKADDGENEVSTYAKNTLPVLEAHLKTAQSLADQAGTQSASSDQQSPSAGNNTSGTMSAVSTATATDTTSDQPSASSGQAATGAAPPKGADGTTTAQTTADQTNNTATTAAARPEGLRTVEQGTISADTLVGTTVYGVNDETLGEVGDLILATEGSKGSIEAIVVDVGGFLGLGAKPVALALADLEIMTDEDGDYYVYSKFSEEQLEGAVEYDEASFEQNRDRMIVRTTR